MSIDTGMETALITLVNETLTDIDVYLESFQKVDFSVYNENVIRNILDKCKFKDIGNVYDYPTDLPQPEVIDGFDLSVNFDMFQRIAVSKKFNSVVMYTIERYEIHCTFFIDTDKLKKFSKVTKELLRQDSRANMFKDIDFKCGKREYIEVSDATGDNMKPADVLKKTVEKEKLVFEDGSPIVQVMNDIHTFFKNDTRKMYEQLEIPYKRGIILFGDPGNGKSAMIREVIRNVPEISKVVINPNVNSPTRILSSLLKSLDGKSAIIIIEDIDSLITDRNRSEFLNILDGVDIKSGVFFIGTTNYPDQIDPAFMNRSGRFDRTYKIDNPSPETRKAFFESRNVGKLLAEYKVFKDDKKKDTDEGVVSLFVKHSEDVPMASLKEIITSTKYQLASNPDMSVEEALETAYSAITTSRTEHVESHTVFKKRRFRMLRDSDDD